MLKCGFVAHNRDGDEETLSFYSKKTEGIYIHSVFLRDVFCTVLRSAGIYRSKRL